MPFPVCLYVISASMILCLPQFEQRNMDHNSMSLELGDVRTPSAQSLHLLCHQCHPHLCICDPGPRSSFTQRHRTTSLGGGCAPPVSPVTTPPSRDNRKPPFHCSGMAMPFPSLASDSLGGSRALEQTPNRPPLLQ